MALKPGTLIEDNKIDRVFIGSCTNARLEDLIEASKVIKGQKISPHVQAMVVPGSQMVKKQAEEMGLDKIFINANFEWREAGCSMCLGMNPDILSPGERCASTSNRSEEHTSELSHRCISYAVFCLKKKKTQQKQKTYINSIS